MWGRLHSWAGALLRPLHVPACCQADTLHAGSHCAFPPAALQSLLRLLLAILRGPLTADEAAAGGSGMEGVQQAGQAGEGARLAAEGPVIDLGGCCFGSVNRLA